jgi:hypothetical protein
VEEHPALLYAAVARSHHVRALALCERRHRLRIGLGQDRLGFAQRRRDTGNPPRPRLGELLQVLGTLEGAVSDEEHRARGDL